MDDETRIREIAKFLHSITPIWQDEILHSYPKYTDNYPEDWIKTLDLLSEEELYLVDSRQDYTSIKKSEFQKFIIHVQELTKLKSEELVEKQLPTWAFIKVKEKKRHEIGTICTYIAELKRKYPIGRILDIGGGVGHLSRILAFYYGFPATSIDQDDQLQELGKKRLKKYPKPNFGNDVEFINAIFGQESDEKKDLINKIFQGNVLTIGLHTCGPLAITHMKRSLEQKSLMLLNFGCCYNKLDSKKDVNLSKIAKSLGIEISGHALTLATRGHNKMTFEDYKLKKNVKKFRYTLHLLLRENFQINEFVTVGEVPARVYKSDFSEYALEKLSTLDLTHNLTSEELMKFFYRKDIQLEVRKMFLCNIIRWQLGRVMELYLLSDRVLWLKENHYQAELKEFFNPALSPRNIGITATRATYFD